MNRKMTKPIFTDPPVAYDPNYFRTIIRSLDQFVVNITAIGDDMVHKIGAGMSHGLLDYIADFRNGNPASACIHLNGQDQDAGTYLIASNGCTYLTSGSYFDGVNWNAKNTASVIISLCPTSGYTLYYDGGLTVGNTFTPTTVMSVDSGGNLWLKGSGGGGGGGSYVLPPATSTVLGGVKIGANVSVTADGTISVAPPSSGAVSSVFGRSGVVVAAIGDYTAAQVTNAVSTLGTYSDPGWITGLSWSKLIGIPSTVVSPLTTKGDIHVFGTADTRLGVGANGQVLTADSTQATGIKWATPAAAPVSSVFGRTGAVVAQPGDYSASQVTNAVDASQVYSNPTWIGSLAWSKITGAPSVSSYQTPWLSNINAAQFNLTNIPEIDFSGGGKTGSITCTAGGFNVNALAGATLNLTSAAILQATASLLVYNSTGAGGVAHQFGTSLQSSALTILVNGNVGILSASPAYPLDVVGDINTSTMYRVAGNPLAAANVVNAVSTAGSYSDPTWLTGLSSSKLIGLVPAVNLGTGTASTSTYLRGDGTWAAVSGIGGNPAGSTGQIQFNNAGAFGADANLFWDDPNNRLGIGTASPSAPLTIGTVRPTVLFDQGVTARCRVAQFVVGHNLYFTANAYYDGTAWQRDDTANSSMLFELDASNGPFSNVFNIGYCAAGTGAIPAWQRPFYFDAANTRFGIGTQSPICRLDISGNSSNNTLLHLSYDGSDTGGYFYPGPGFGLNIATGMSWSAGTAIAKNTSASYINLGTNGNLGFFPCTGLTVGSSFSTPNPMMLVTPSGVSINSPNVPGSPAVLDVIGHIRMSGTRSTLFYHGDTAGHVGGIQIVGLGNNNVILTPTDNTGAPVNGQFQLGGAGTFNSNAVSLSVQGATYFGGNCRINTSQDGGPTAGSLTGGFYYGWSDNSFGLQVGHLGSNGACWLQAQRADGNGSVYQLQLNPIGGNVSLNTGSNWSACSIYGQTTIMQPNGSSSTTTHLVLKEQSMNPAYGFYIGYIPYSAWSGSIQVIDGNAGGPLCLNPSGGNIGHGNTTNPAYIVDVHGFSNTLSQVHISYDSSDTGGYLFGGSSGGLTISAGASLNGSWIAKSTGCEVIGFSASGNLYFYTMSGLPAAGTAFTMSQACMMINPSGYMFISTGGGVPYCPLDVDGVFRVGRSTRNNLAAANTWTGVEIFCNGASGAGAYVRNTDRSNNAASPAFPPMYFPSSVNCLGMDTTTKNIIQSTATPTYSLQCAADSAGKPGTSTWTVVSDVRLKRNIEPMADDSLSMLEALRWIRFEYNGLYQAPEGLKGVGLLAHELKEIIPEAVGSGIAQKFPVTTEEDTGIPHTAKGIVQVEEEVLDISYHHIIVHSARAIQQLSKRIMELETKLAA